MTEISARMRLARMRARMTQKDVAEQIGYTDSCVGVWERDGTIRIEDFMKFCEIVHADPVWVLVGADLTGEVTKYETKNLLTLKRDVDSVIDKFIKGE